MHIAVLALSLVTMFILGIGSGINMSISQMEVTHEKKAAKLTYQILYGIGISLAIIAAILHFLIFS